MTCALCCHPVNDPGHLIQEMEIGEVEELLQRRGILKDPVLADKAKVMQKEREAREAEMRAMREKENEAGAAVA